MFVRKKPNKSGSVSVQVVAKTRSRRQKVIKSIGSSKDPKEIERLMAEGRDYINVGHQLRDINDATSQSYPRNTYTNNDWAAMEEAGCIFLPCAGYRLGNNTQSAGNSGMYWSASRNSSKTAKYVRFSSMAQLQTGSRCSGRSVRLAKDL